MAERIFYGCGMSGGWGEARGGFFARRRWGAGGCGFFWHRTVSAQGDDGGRIHTKLSTCCGKKAKRLEFTVRYVTY